MSYVNVTDRSAAMHALGAKAGFAGVYNPPTGPGVTTWDLVFWESGYKDGQEAARTNLGVIALRDAVIDLEQARVQHGRGSDAYLMAFGRALDRATTPAMRALGKQTSSASPPMAELPPNGGVGIQFS